MGFAIKIVQCPAVPERAAADAEFRALGVERQCVRRIGLQLDGVGAGRLGLADQPDRLLEILAVIAGQLGDDIGRVARSDATVIDADARRHYCSLRFSKRLAAWPRT